MQFDAKNKFVREMIKTSKSHPLQIASVDAGTDRGMIGVTFAPGKTDRQAIEAPGHEPRQGSRRDRRLGCEDRRDAARAARVRDGSPSRGSAPKYDAAALCGCTCRSAT